MELAEVINILKERRPVLTPEAAAFSRLILLLLAQGQPVTPERLAEVSGQPIEMIRAHFAAMHKGGCDFDDRGALVGNALTLTPTPHRFRVNGHELYAWCALDTLFLPALIDQTAEIASTCPQTGESVQLTVSPDGIVEFSPAETALSIVIASGCTSGIDGTFCGQIHFFASSDAAETWRADRADVTLLPLAEAYQLAQVIYAEPMLSALRH